MKKIPLISWIPRHAAHCVSRNRILDDGRTLCSATVWKRLGNDPVVEFVVSQYTSDQSVRTTHCEVVDQKFLRGVSVGHHERSGAAIFLHAR